MKVPASGPLNAQILIVGECPGKSDVFKSEPFVGAGGQELSRMLHEVGILRSECRFTYTINYLPPNGDVSFFFRKQTEKEWIPSSELAQGIEELWQEIERINPVLIIPLGAVSLWAVTGEKSIAKWRGSIMEASRKSDNGTPYKTVPTYSPSLVLKVWEYRHIVVQDLRRAFRESKFRDIHLPEYKWTIRPSFEEAINFLEAILERLNSNQLVLLSCDIETIAHQISCVGYAISKTEAICIPLMTKDNPTGYWNKQQELILVLKQREILTHSNVKLIGQNFIYDIQYFIRFWGVWPKVFHDTMVAWHVLFPGEKKSLDFISSMICQHYLYWKDESKDFHAYPINEEQYWRYNCKDTCYTFEDAEAIMPMLYSQNLREQYQFLIDLHEPVIKMMLRGVLCDTKHKNELSFELMEQQADYAEWFEQILPGRAISPKSKSTWYNSVHQQKKLFYEQCGLPVQKNKKNKRPSIDDEALEVLKLKDPLLAPIFQKLQEYRSIGVFKSTFVDMALDRDNRIRCSFKIAGPETFRFASSQDAFGYGTNLQNIPSGNEEN